MLCCCDIGFELKYKTQKYFQAYFSCFCFIFFYCLIDSILTEFVLGKSWWNMENLKYVSNFNKKKVFCQGLKAFMFNIQTKVQSQF